MGPPGSPKGATEVPHGAPRQLQGSRIGAPWDLQAAAREPLRWPMGPPGSPKVSTGSSKWYLWESEAGCLILGARVQDSESGR